MTREPGAVVETFETIVGDLGPEFDFRSLKLTAQTRYDPPKRLLIEYTDMSADTLGEWCPYRDMNLIRVQAGLDNTLRLLVILHEIGHLLLDHLPPSTLTYAQANGQPVPGHVRHRLHVDWAAAGHDDPWSDAEYAAETLARLLLDCIIRKETSFPDLTKDVHSW